MVVPVVNAGKRSWISRFSGVVAGAIVALAVGLGVAWVLANQYGTRGPAGDFLAWHSVAAVAVLAAQLRADGTVGPARRGERDPLGAVAALLVVGVAVALGTLWFS